MIKAEVFWRINNLSQQIMPTIMNIKDNMYLLIKKFKSLLPFSPKKQKNQSSL
jgi:hypothetical protein